MTCSRTVPESPPPAGSHPRPLAKHADVPLTLLRPQKVPKAGRAVPAAERSAPHRRAGLPAQDAARRQRAKWRRGRGGCQARMARLFCGLGLLILAPGWAEGPGAQAPGGQTPPERGAHSLGGPLSGPHRPSCSVPRCPGLHQVEPLCNSVSAASGSPASCAAPSPRAKPAAPTRGLADCHTQHLLGGRGRRAG